MANPNPLTLTSRSTYADQIRAYLCAGFHPEQMIIYTSTQVFTNQLRVLGHLSEAVGRQLRFTDREGRDFIEKGYKSNHRAKGYMLPETEQMLAEYFAPHNRDLIKLLISKPFVVDHSALAAEFPTSSVVPVNLEAQLEERSSSGETQTWQ